jgi:hypothetical protein
MSYIKTGDPINKNQPVSPLIIGTVRSGGIWGQLFGIGMEFEVGFFEGWFREGELT